MGYSSDFMPHLGAVPDSPGQFIIAGFSGHSMPEILLSSKGVAAMIREDKNFEQTQLPHIFKTTKSRSEEHTSELQSQSNLVCRLLLEKKKKKWSLYLTNT